jgi:hypothetical protein
MNAAEWCRYKYGVTETGMAETVALPGAAAERLLKLQS